MVLQKIEKNVVLRPHPPMPFNLESNGAGTAHNSGNGANIIPPTLCILVSRSFKESFLFSNLKLSCSIEKFINFADIRYW